MDGMMEKGRTEPAGSPQRSQEAGGGEPAGGPPQRFSAKRKLRAVNRLLRGDPLELVARELNVTAARAGPGSAGRGGGAEGTGARRSGR